MIHPTLVSRSFLPVYQHRFDISDVLQIGVYCRHKCSESQQKSEDVAENWCVCVHVTHRSLQLLGLLSMVSPLETSSWEANKNERRSCVPCSVITSIVKLFSILLPSSLLFVASIIFVFVVCIRFKIPEIVRQGHNRTQWLYNTRLCRKLKQRFFIICFSEEYI